MYCSQCGAKLVVKGAEGHSPSACPACGQVVRPLLRVGAGVLVQRDGALLLVLRASTNSGFPSTWNLPAGYCKVDEPPLITATRKASEETGWQIKAGRLAGAYYYYDDDDDPRGNGVLLVFEAEIVDEKCQDGTAEATDVGFFTVDQLPEPLGGAGHDQAIRAWRAHVSDRWRPGMPMRYCPHCALPLQVRMTFDRLRSVCTVCGFVNFRTPKVGVSVLVEEGDRVLLIRRGVEPGVGMWCLPSGFVEWDESPEAAAVRECAEETGLVIAVTELLEVRHYTDDYRGPGINLTYRVQARGGTLRPGDDAVEVRFFAPGELPPWEAIAFRSHRLDLKQWLGFQARHPDGLGPDSANDMSLR